MVSATHNREQYYWNEHVINGETLIIDTSSLFRFAQAGLVEALGSLLSEAQRMGFSQILVPDFCIFEIFGALDTQRQTLEKAADSYDPSNEVIIDFFKNHSDVIKIVKTKEFRNFRVNVLNHVLSHDETPVEFQNLSEEEIKYLGFILGDAEGYKYNESEMPSPDVRVKVAKRFNTYLKSHDGVRNDVVHGRNQGGDRAIVELILSLNEPCRIITEDVGLFKKAIAAAAKEGKSKSVRVSTSSSLVRYLGDKMDVTIDEYEAKLKNYHKKTKGAFMEYQFLIERKTEEYEGIRKSHHPHTDKEDKRKEDSMRLYTAI